MNANNIKIEYPVIAQDFDDLIMIVSENLVFDKNLTAEYFQGMSSGEILLAKNDDDIVGVLVNRRPGKIFTELPDEHFDLEQIKYKKSELGYVAIVAIKKDFQGKGIGNLLFQEALELQKSFGSKAVIVHCWQGSPGKGSEKLFSSFGFKPLKVHKQPWHDYAEKVGPKGHRCAACGNPCTCDELLMILYLDKK